MDVLEKIKQNGNQSAALLPEILKGDGEFELKWAGYQSDGNIIRFPKGTSEILDSIINAHINGKTIKSVTLKYSYDETTGWLHQSLATQIIVTEQQYPNSNKWQLRLTFDIGQIATGNTLIHSIIYIQKSLGTKNYTVKVHNYTDLIDLTVEEEE